MSKYKLVLEAQLANAQLATEHVCGGLTKVKGKDKLTGQFSYDLEVAVDRLDKDGFVFDNQNVETIKGLFADKTYIASCELLAGGLVLFMMSFEDMKRRLTYARARVYNLTGFAEVEWVPGMEPPAGPRIPTTKECAAISAAKASGKKWTGC